MGDKKEQANCFITRQEMLITEKDEIIDLQFFKARIIHNKTLLLLLDTNIYTNEEEVKEYEKCINVFLKFPQVLSLEQIAKKQQDFLLDAVEQGLQQGIDKIVFIGHHPLGHVKIKKENVKLTSDIPQIYPVLLDIQSLVNKNNHSVKYYYLCADFHSYQQGSISLTKQGESSMKIEQYISGTGGTELDDEIPLQNKDFVSSNKNKINDIILDYTLNENRREWGFLVCYPTEDKLVCEFQPVKLSKNPVIGGKTRRRKNRFFIFIVENQIQNQIQKKNP